MTYIQNTLRPAWALQRLALCDTLHTCTKLGPVSHPSSENQSLSCHWTSCDRKSHTADVSMLTAFSHPKELQYGLQQDLKAPYVPKVSPKSLFWLFHSYTRFGSADIMNKIMENYSNSDLSKWSNTSREIAFEYLALCTTSFKIENGHCFVSIHL